VFYLFYNLLSLFLLIPVVLFTLYRSVTLKWPLALAARFGIIPSLELLKLQSRPVILLHAVSVGEIMAARPLIRSLRSRYPDHALVVSSSTETGRQTASTFTEIDLCIYFPFDFLPSVRQTLQSLNPSLIIIMETEIWPNFTREAARRGIPLIMANGRISDRSFPRYLKLSWFFRRALQNFTLLCMQSEVARERIIAIGAPAERVVVCGNLKYDIPFHRVSAAERSMLRLRYRIPDNLFVITAGSTRSYEQSCEEEMLVKAYQSLLGDFEQLFLVLVPRHPQRSGDVVVLLDMAGIRFRTLSELKSNDSLPFRSGEVLLVDRVGELMNFYSLADLAFVGGSLVPIGGHNLLEPASLGVPLVFGTDMSNFREIAALVLENRAGVQVNTSAELASAFRYLVGNPVERQKLGDNGLEMMRLNGGAAERHMEAIAGQLLSR